MLQPALFLHFALVVSGDARFRCPHTPSRLAGAGLPARRAASLALPILPCCEQLPPPAGHCAGMLERSSDWAYLATLFIVIASSGPVAAVMPTRTRQSRNKQLKWISRGTVLAIAPFTLYLDSDICRAQ